jgi:hypothetical protein
MVLDDEARRRQLGRIGDARQRRGRCCKPDVARKAVMPLKLREIRSGMVDAKVECCVVEVLLDRNLDRRSA